MFAYTYVSTDNIQGLCVCVGGFFYLQIVAYSLSNFASCFTVITMLLKSSQYSLIHSFTLLHFNLLNEYAPWHLFIHVHTDGILDCSQFISSPTPSGMGPYTYRLPAFL